MLLSLTESRNGSLKYADCKQNRAYWFQIINLLFTVRKWPTFNAKVAEFLSQTNGFYAQSDVPCISAQALLEKHCLSQSAGINKFAVWFFLLADDVVYLEQCFLKADNGFSCLQAFGFQDI